MTGTRYPDLAAVMEAAAQAVDAGDDASAEPLFLQIVALNPRDADAWHMLAIIAVRAGRAGEAKDRAERAHQLQRRNHLYLNTLGVAHAETQRFQDAERCFRRALKERPDYAEGHYNLAKTLAKLNQFPAAEASYHRALRLDPSRVDVANNLADLYCRVGRYHEALPLLEKASAASPGNIAIALNMGLALLACRGAAAAGVWLADFLKRHPESPVRGDLALNLLMQGRFEEGWREYATAKRTPTAVPPSQLVSRLPEPISGRDVLLIPEQGIGDHLFFLRFARVLRDRGARLGLIASAKLYDMLRGHPELDCLVRNGEGIPQHFKRALPVMLGNIPAMLGSAEPPPPFPIVVPDARLVLWRRRLAEFGPPPYLGVTWRAGRTREPTAEFARKGPVPLYKEVPIEALAAAIRGWRGTVIVLQRLPLPDEMARFSSALGRDAQNLSALNEKLEDMAAVLWLVEEYVGVSNTNMHIRAGIGKSAQVLIPFPPEFRWMHEGERSPWFPGFILYRQSTEHDWTAALSRLHTHVNR